MVSNTVNQGRIPFWKSNKFKYSVTAFLFVLPALINFTIFRYYPITWSVRASLWDYSLLGGYSKFVGLGNYAKAFSDPSFLHGLWLSLKFTLYKVSLQVAIALALAVFVNQKKRGMGFARTIMFIPVVISYIVVSVIWGLLLNKDYGLVNSFLVLIGLPRAEFFTSIKNAFPSIVAISIWKDIGYSVLLLVAGMKGISEVYYEAAKIDGANGIQRFFSITIPLLKKTLMFIVVTQTMSAFQIFVPVFSLTQGGPRRSTMVSMYYIYQKAFVYGEMGYASALSLIILIILLFVSIFQMRLFEQK
jgi:multiple sugar transport system permease protein